MSDKEEARQEFHKLAKPVGQGKDEYGRFKMIPMSMVRGGKLTPRKVYSQPIPHLILDQNTPPRGWYKLKHESPKKRPRPCYTEAILTTPYGGFCPINCGHCYVNNGTRGYRATGVATVDPSYPAKMQKRIDKMMIGSAAYITSFTEPFHKLEERYHITEELSGAFIRAGLPVFYLSREIPPDWAIDNLLLNPYSYMQWSINTSNPEHYRKFSPGSFDLDEVFACMSHMSDLGIFISVQCNPILAGITTLEELLKLCELVADAGGHHIIFKFVEQVMNNRQVIVDRMRQRKLPNVSKFDAWFSQVIGGVYTIQEHIRIEWLNELLKKTREVGLTMGLCYEYFGKNPGTNLAPWYTTADQCHGRGVPIFYRPEPGAKFKPLPGCYRKGCLYCEEYGTHACGNDRLLEAGMLKFSDYRSILLEGDDGNWDLPGSCLHPDYADMHLDEVLGNPGLLTDAEMWDWPALDNRMKGE